MNHEAIYAVAFLLAYVIWLVVFVLVIERGLRRLTEMLFGVRITRELNKVTGPSSNISVLEILDVYRWRVDQPASLSVRFGVGMLRVGFWLLAVAVPLAFALYVLFVVRHQRQP
jgi:hypothetical protein